MAVKKTQVTGKFANVFGGGPKLRPSQLLLSIVDDYIYEKYNNETSYHRLDDDGKPIARGFYPSKLDGAVCARRLVFEYIDAEHKEGSKSFSSQVIRMFHSAQDTHERIQEKYLAELHTVSKEYEFIGRWKCLLCGNVVGNSKKKGIEHVLGALVRRPDKCKKCGAKSFKYIEPYINVTDLRLRCKLDGVIVERGERKIVEIKTTNPFSFSALSGVPKYYLVQSNLYMHFSGYHETVWIFENRSNNTWVEFRTSYDYDIIKDILRVLVEANKYITSKKLPPVLDDSALLAVCKKCEFSSICRVATKFEYNLKVVSQV